MKQRMARLLNELVVGALWPVLTTLPAFARSSAVQHPELGFPIGAFLSPGMQGGLPFVVTLGTTALLLAILVIEFVAHRRDVSRMRRMIDLASDAIERQVADRTRQLAATRDTLVEEINELRTSEFRLRSSQAILEETTEQYVRLSQIDPVTTLANRRRFDEAIGREWRRGIRNGRQLSLVLVDLDFFKQFNETYGHGTGDDCLRAIADVLMTAARRPSDLVARIGGDKFAVLLYDTGGEGSLIVASLIQSATEQLAIEHETTKVPNTAIVTVSIGVATFLPDRTWGPSLLTFRADEALYAAKQDGRNCIRSYEESTATRNRQLAVRDSSFGLRTQETLVRHSRG